MRPLPGLLAAETVSLAGSHIATVAVPWLVLVTTGSATRVGVVALAQTLPFVLAGVLGGALVDRTGPRRVAIAADVVSAITVGLIPLLHLFGQLTFGRLVATVAVSGAVAGCGAVAKRALLPVAVEVSGTPMGRATGLFEGLSRAALLVGLPLGGILVASFGPATVLLIDAASFAVAAVLVTTTVRFPAADHQTAGSAVAPAAPAAADPPPQTRAGVATRGIAAGFAFLRRDRLILAVTAMLFFTNLADQAYIAVFLPVWVRETGAGPAAFGLVGGVFGLGAVLGATAYSILAVRVPRALTFVVCFLIAGSPRLFTLALSNELWLILAVAFGAGLAIAAVNPILMAVGYERIPAHLRGRVLGVIGALSYAGLPLGGLLGGLAVDGTGLRAALLSAGALYLAVTLAPLFFLSRLTRSLEPPASVEPSTSGDASTSLYGGPSDAADHPRTPSATVG
ncbi:MFS transporter [Actinoplanes sp. Pm04-4]|uniref:Multidrug efflux pump Tap n=1 Tax=Paractinoplanes pyxinae TaxID=2997416 RepID=A0ABT4B3K3_9ACTN|nr:MFS transporter [Actinoplanes pyxinae]MCY1140188.1 MFS transporter [Actinoplanes pyxinae]